MGSDSIDIADGEGNRVIRLQTFSLRIIYRRDINCGWLSLTRLSFLGRRSHSRRNGRIEQMRAAKRPSNSGFELVTEQLCRSARGRISSS